MPAQENGFINPMHGKSYGEFRAWLQSCIADAAQKGLADGWKVPESTYWLFDGDRPVGYGKIRHFLTDKLLEDGGSIGYAVRPAERQKGYGTAFMRLLLAQCAALGIPKVLAYHPQRQSALPQGRFGQRRRRRAHNRQNLLHLDCLLKKSAPPRFMRRMIFRFPIDNRLHLCYTGRVRKTEQGG